jgi:hypothetical protein
MWRIVGIIVLMVTSCGKMNQQQASKNQTSQNQQSKSAEELIVFPMWIGPGLYYGTWYENQEDYEHWQDEQRQNYQNWSQQQRQDFQNRTAEERQNIQNRAAQQRQGGMQRGDRSPGGAGGGRRR